MTEPTEEQVLRWEEEGFAAALLFVATQSEERWPMVDDVKKIHGLIFEKANPAMAGQYRLGNYEPQYTHFAVPDWNRVQGCMLQYGKLMETAKRECDSAGESERDDKVIEWAARLHHRLECIHPFQDGNGRTGRVLASWMLMYYDLPSFDVTPETRPAYIAALDAADRGLTLQDLENADYWPHQTAALRELIDFIQGVLSEEIVDEDEAE